MSSLSDFPIVVLDVLLKKLDLKSILSLRKVNMSFRGYIKKANHDFALKKLAITITTDLIIYDFSTASDQIEIQYQKHPNGCLVIGSKGEVVIDTDYLTASCKDLAVILKYQKSILKRMTIELDCEKKSDIESITVDYYTILRKTITEIKAVKFYMEATNEDEMLLVLPLFQPKTLEVVDFINPSYVEDSDVNVATLDLKEIMKLEQWKQAKQFEFGDFKLDCDLTAFARFPATTVFVNTLTASDLFHLKEEIMKNPEFECFFIKYEEFNDYDNLRNLFGDETKFKGYTEWYAHNSENNKTMCLVMELCNMFFFHYESE